MSTSKSAGYRDVYTTEQGDMWDLISRKVFGSEKYASDLMRANPVYLDVAVFSAGAQLVCPDIEIQRATPLPPWKQA